MAERDFTHLTPDEKINGIKASKLPDHIRSKYHGEDVREAIAQSTELTIQLGINMGLSPDDALSWARKLQETVSQSEFDSWVSTLLDGGPSIFMNTLNELKTKYPNGASGVALVRETDPAKIYVWNGTAWEDFGDYQGIAINDNTVTTSKIVNGAVTHEKVSFIHTPHDYANPDNYTSLHLTNNYYKETGVLTPLNGAHSIVISAGQYDVIRFYFNQGFDVYFTEWDAANTFLNGKRLRYTNESGALSYIVSNSNTDYVLVNVAYAYIDQITVTKNEKNNRFPLQNEIKLNGQNIIDESISADKTDFVKSPTNLFDKARATNAGYYFADGSYRTDLSYMLFSTETIPAVKGDVMYFKAIIDNITRHITEFNENGDYLTGDVFSSSFNPAGTIATYKVKNENAVGIKVNVHVDEVDDFIITKNQNPNSMSLDENVNVNTITPIEPYQATFMEDNIVGRFNMVDGSILGDGTFGAGSATKFTRSENKIPIETNTNYVIETRSDLAFKIYGYDVNGAFVPGEHFSNKRSGDIINFKNATVKTVMITTSTDANGIPSTQISPNMHVVLKNYDKKQYVKSDFIQDGGISNKHISQDAIEPYHTTFMDSGYVATFQMIEGSIVGDGTTSGSNLSDNIRSKTKIPIETGVSYTIKTTSPLAFKIYGYDLDGVYITGQHFTSKRSGDLFTFTNDGVKTIGITTAGGDTFPDSQISPNIKVDLYKASVKPQIKSEYLPPISISGATFDFPKTDVFTAKSDFGSRYFRIPFGVTTKHGTLIAGADIRMTGGGDFGDNRIGVARSTDGGTTWIDKKQVINNTFIGDYPRAMDGLALYDSVNDEVYIFGCKLTDASAWYADGASKEGWDFVYVKSTDDGVTWSSETSLKSLIDIYPERDRFLTGVGRGTQMANGTLVVPIQYSTAGVIKSGIIYSQDSGATWLMSAGEIPDKSSENNVVETTAGILLMNARGFNQGKKRVIYKTTDLGATWIPMPSNDLSNEGSIYQGGDCMGSMINYTSASGKPHILFSVPFDKTGTRSNTTLFKSADGGETFKPISTIFYGNFDQTFYNGYTNLLDLNGRLFILMENNGTIELWEISSLTPLVNYEPNMLPK